MSDQQSGSSSLNPPTEEQGLAPSLRQPADSVTERLLTLAGTDEGTQEFTDDMGESSAIPFNRFPVALSSGSIIFADENSSSPLAAPDASSIQGIFRDTSNLTQSEEKEPMEMQSPPRMDRVGLEALSSSPQQQPPKESMEQPWEMAQSHLPDLTATETPTKHSPKYNGEDNSEDGVSPAQRLTRLLICCVVVLALFLSLWFMPESDNVSGSPGIRVTLSPTLAPTTVGMTEPTQQPSSSSMIGTPSPTTAVGTTLPPVTSAPTFGMTVPTPPPSSSPIVRTPSPTVTGGKTLAPTFEPTIARTTQPSLSPTTNIVNPPTTVNFTSQVSFQGATSGTRLGVGVVLDPSGTFFASLDGRGEVQLYQDSSSGDGNWTLVSTIASSSNEPVEYMDLVVVDGIPQVALASSDLIQVLEYRNLGWNSLGNVPWSSGSSSSMTAPTVALSSNGSSLAAASLENGGNNWNVQVWEWDTSSWTQKGMAVIKNSTSNLFLSLSLDISGDGETFVLGDWTIATMAVNVYAYRWDGQEWNSLGSSPSFLWGPVAVTMRHDGNCFAAATPTPSTSRVYEWNETIQDWEVVGTDLLGGTAIALADNGRRVVVGSPTISIVSIYDQSSNGSWDPTAVLNSTIGDQFGSSLSIEGDGNILVVGSPLDDQGGNNAGQVTVYA